jgi:hypothetical protein
LLNKHYHKGIHEFTDAKEAIKKPEFYRRGNTVLLVPQLYKNNVMTTLSENQRGHHIFEHKCWNVICGLSMQTQMTCHIYPQVFKH